MVGYTEAYIRRKNNKVRQGHITYIYRCPCTTEQHLGWWIISVPLLRNAICVDAPHCWHCHLVVMHSIYQHAANIYRYTVV